MDPEFLIPARFDHREAAAGLRSLEHSGGAVDDVTHAADSAVARFQQAHESIQAASRGFLDLRRAAGSAADPDAEPGARRSTDHPPATEDGAGLRSSEPTESYGRRAILAGPRPGHHDSLEPATPEQLTHPTDPGGRGLSSRRGVGAAEATHADRSEERAAAHAPDADAREEASRVAAAAVGRAAVESPALGQTVGRSLRIASPNEGPRRPLDEGPRHVDTSGRIGDRIGGPVPHDESGGLDVDLAAVLHGPATSLAQGLAPDLAGWKGRSRRRVAHGPAGPGEAGPDALDHRAPATALDDDTTAGRGLPGVDLDAWEAIRRMRTAAPSWEPIARRSFEESAALPRSSASSQGGPEASFQSGGVTSGSVIERLLREQNDLIRQDAQRAASPPISAPPPLRHGGLRMGS